MSEYKLNPFSGQLDNVTPSTQIDVTNAPASGTPGSASRVSTGDPNTKGLIVKGNTYSPSGTDPSAITGLQCWFKADSITGLSDSDPITTWTDSSGNSRNATQAVSGKRPLYKTNIINSQPVVHFDGVDDFLQTAGFTLAQPETVFIVIKELSVHDAVSYVFDGINGTDDMVGYFPGGKFRMYAGLNGPVSDAVVGLTNFQIFICTYNGAASNLWQNGTLSVNSPANAGTRTPGGLTIGNSANGSWPEESYIAEIGVYNKTLSTVERQGLESYLAVKYGITTASSTAQTSNLVEYQSASSAVLSGVDKDGKVFISTNAGAPTGSPAAGTIVYDTVNEKFWVYNGSTWKYAQLS